MTPHHARPADVSIEGWCTRGWFSSQCEPRGYLQGGGATLHRSNGKHGAAGRSSGFFSPLIDSFSLRYTSTDISSLPHNKISHSQYKHKMAPLSPNWHTRGATDTKRRQETRSGSRPCAIQARFARPPPRRMAAWLLLSPPVASKTTPGSTVNRCGWGSKILRAVQEGAQAQLGFEQAKERWFGRRARTVHGNSISREFVKPRSRV